MPDNQIPSKSTPGAEPTEFKFDQATENPRIKRRTLKAKPATGLTKPEDSAVSAARELEREAPPRTESPAPAPQTAPVSAQPKSVPVVVRAATASATPPPKTTPTTSPANGSATTRPTSGSTASSTTSPHGTRPATLYYTSPTRKEAAPASTAKATSAPAAASAPSAPTSKAATTPATSPSPMKTVSGSASTTSSTASTPNAAASASSTAARTAAAGAPRSTSPQPDYRANVERQSREQKSVGSILSYIVYGLIAFFLISAILAGYGAKTIFDRLHDQSATVSELDQNFSDKNKELNAKLVVTQDTLTQVQAQATRAQDVIVKQQEEINALRTSLNDSISALKSEKATRAQDSAAIRARLKDLENRSPFSTTNNNR